MSDKKWRGIQVNEVRLMGTLPNDPQYIPAANNSEWAYFALRTIFLEQGANGQFSEADVDIPVIVSTPNMIKVVKEHIKAGRELYVSGYYKNWNSNDVQQHAIFATNIKLGRSPFTPQNAPSLPEG